MNTTSVIVDCHAYAWHEYDDEYPECGPDNLIRFAETYGVIVEFLDDDESPAPRWAWWYRITGPRDNVRRFLLDEYAGGDDDLVDDMLGEAVIRWR
jgi:hypothetical protein